MEEVSTKFDIKKKAMLKALERNLGIVTASAKQVKIDRTTHYVWLKEDPAYKEAVEELNDVALDFAEGKLHGKIKKGDTIATIFYLKTKGKKRGYIEKTEMQISKDDDVSLDLTPE